MVPLTFRGLSLVALMIGMGCDSSPTRNPVSSQSLREDSAAYSGTSPIRDSDPAEMPNANSEPSIAVDLPTPDQPVTGAMICENASNDTDSATLKVWIKLLIARGHYIYAPTDAEGPFRTLSVDLKTPSAAIDEEGWKFPSSKTKSGHAVYYDSVVVHGQIRLSGAVTSELNAIVQCQACNEDVCYPPAKLQLNCSIGRSP